MKTDVVCENDIRITDGEVYLRGAHVSRESPEELERSLRRALDLYLSNTQGDRVKMALGELCNVAQGMKEMIDESDVEKGEAVLKEMRDLVERIKRIYKSAKRENLEGYDDHRG